MPTVSSEIVRHLSPEEEELARKQAELSLLQAELADRELELADLRTKLNSFEGRYLRQVGALYAELDEWDAKIAELEAKLDNSPSARQRAERARRNAENTHKATHGQASKAPDIKPSADLKNLFRKAARQFHPDLAKDAVDEKRRNQVFIQAKEAFDRGDAETLHRLLDDNPDDGNFVGLEGVAAQLIRVIRQIARVRKQIGLIATEIASLSCSEIAKLKQQEVTAKTEGRDLLAELAASISVQLARARKEYQALSEEARSRGK
jgi:chromosome segregation ATPase